VTPERMRILVSWVLLGGVSLAAALIATGLVGSLLVGWRGSLLGQPHVDIPIDSFADLGAGLRALRPLAISQLGLVVLIATPIVRVVTSLVAFALERDRLYVALTGIVLAILLASALFIR
jgi:uncharacterized membrane protein